MHRCAFCKGPLEMGQRCENCGSFETEKAEPTELFKSEPFHYNGYIVWALREMRFAYDKLSYYFYLGDRLVDIIKVSMDVLKAFVPEEADSFPFVWDLFLVSQGEEEVLRVTELNRIHPATFEVRRVETEHEEYISGLTWDLFREEYRNGKVRSSV